MSQSNSQCISADPIVARILSSSIGSLLTALAVTPLDVVKVRQQAVSAEPFNKEALAQCTRCGAFVMNNGLIHGELVLPKNLSPHFSHLVCNMRSVGSAMGASATTPLHSHSSQFPSSITRGIAQIYRTEGLSGIYAGLAPTLVMSIPATVLYFTAYDELKLKFSRHSLVGESAAPAIAGMSARILASAVTSPFELVRTLMQSKERAVVSVTTASSASNRSSGSVVTARMGIIESMRILVQNGGILSLWRGLEPTLWRDVPFSAIYWFVLENAKKRIEKAYPAQSPMAASLRDFGAGAAGGMLAAAITTPFDLVKTRRQVYSAVSGNSPDAARDQSAAAGNGSTPRVLREIIREEGMTGAFRGLSARVLKIAPACAIMIASYESGKRYLSPHLK